MKKSKKNQACTSLFSFKNFISATGLGRALGGGARSLVELASTVVCTLRAAARQPASMLFCFLFKVHQHSQYRIGFLSL